MLLTKELWMQNDQGRNGEKLSPRWTAVPPHTGPSLSRSVHPQWGNPT